MRVGWDFDVELDTWRLELGLHNIVHAYLVIQWILA